MAQRLGSENHMFAEWESNSPQGWLWVGVLYASLGAAGALLWNRESAGTWHTVRVAWLVALVVCHSLVLSALPRIAPNETRLVFASLYEIPGCLLLLVVELDWRRLLRRPAAG